MAVIVSLNRRLRFVPQENSWNSPSVRGWVNPWAIVRLKGLGKLKITSGFIRNGTNNLPACKIVSEPTKILSFRC
jgi:hypothetical protein